MTTEEVLAALRADGAALAAAAVAAEDALCLTREALAMLTEGWDGESATAATDLVAQQCAEGSGVIDELHRVAGQVDPQPQLAAPPPLAQPSFAPPPVSLPVPALGGLGGSLAGLIAQVADSLAADGYAAAEISEDGAGAPEVTAVSAEPEPEPELEPEPVAAPVVVPPAQPVPPVPVPLLAAELPPPVAAVPVQTPAGAEPAAAEPAAEPGEVPDPATPCEIAADELPQVGP